MAMGEIPQAESGAAAGLYSMSRFFGSIMGTTLVGVILQQALAYTSTPIIAYRTAFASVATAGFIGLLIVWRAREEQRA